MKDKWITVEQRLKDNVKNYQMHQLVNMTMLENQLMRLKKLYQTDFIVMDNFGKKIVEIGNRFTDENLELSTSFEIKIKKRTIATIYINTDVVPFVELPRLIELCKMLYEMIEEIANITYLQKEYELYSVALEERLDQEQSQLKNGIKEDTLTGTLNKSYFRNRVSVVERSGIVPVVVICGNINDWKYANDNYGDDESNRLIQIIAGIIIEESRPEYIIGRVDGDVFHILMPLVEEKEAKEYCARVQEKCMAFDDPHLAPSIAFGMVMRNNIEQDFKSLFSEAEYIMFEDKFRMKNKKGYEQRLKKGKL